MCWQARYTAGTKEILRRFFENIPLNPTDVIVAVGTLCPSESCQCGAAAGCCCMALHRFVGNPQDCVQGGKLASQYDQAAKEGRNLEFKEVSLPCPCLT